MNIIAIVVAIAVVVIILALGVGVATIVVGTNCFLFWFVVFNMIVVSGEENIF